MLYILYVIHAHQAPCHLPRCHSAHDLQGPPSSAVPATGNQLKCAFWIIPATSDAMLSKTMCHLQACSVFTFIQRVAFFCEYAMLSKTMCHLQACSVFTFIQRVAFSVSMRCFPKPCVSLFPLIPNAFITCMSSRRGV
jgi:hypothetical protein